MKNKQFLAITLLLLISFITYFRWLSFGFFTSGDWGFAFAETLEEYKGWTIWVSNLGFGQIDLLLWRSPITSLYGFLGFLGFDQNISEKILIFWPSIILSNICIFFISKKTTKSTLGSIFAAVIFNYSTYYIISGSAFLLYASTSFLIFSFLILMNLLEKRKLYLYLAFLLSFSITVFLDFRITYIGFFLHALYIFYFELVVIRRSAPQALKAIFPFVLFFALFLILNFYWVFPLSQTSLLTENPVLNRGLFGNEFLTIFNAFSLQHPFWTGGRLAIFEIQRVQPYFWIFPFTAFLGLLLNRRNKIIVFFAIVALIGILLTKQSGSPFPTLYRWLFENIPGFNAFREASKFYPLILLGYAILIASFIGFLEEKWKKGIAKDAFYFLAFLFFLICLLPIKPILSGQAGSIYTGKKMPEDYEKIKQLLIYDEDFYRTLWIPTLSRWGFYSNNHPEVSGIEVIKNDWFSFVKDLDIEKFFEGEMVMDLMGRSYTDSLLDMSSIKYVFVPLEDVSNDDNFFIHYGLSREEYINLLDTYPFLERKDMNFGKIVVYENKNFKPHIYKTDFQDDIFNTQKAEKVFFIENRPTQYNFVASKVSKSFYLNFSEGFNEGWRIKIGDFSWIKAILKNNDYFLSGDLHMKNTAGLNSFLIDPSVVCKVENQCVKNSEGSYTITGTLYFLPQAYLIIGAFLSVTIFMVLSLILFLAFFKRK